MNKSIIIHSRDCIPCMAYQSWQELNASAERDSCRPNYHLCPPGGWMNDPNGAIFCDGWYHIFCLVDPFSADGCSGAILSDGTCIPGDQKPNRFWAHMRSKNLVDWEILPFALCPDRDNGEIKPISGSVIEREDGTHFVMFTSVRQNGENQQYGAESFDGTYTWKRCSQPLLQLPTHVKDKEWRDPYLFHYNGETFAIVAWANCSTAGLLLYQAEDSTLMKWTYRGEFFSCPTKTVPYFECPRIFFINGKAVLLFSPYSTMRYYVGTIDQQTMRFTPSYEGILSFDDVMYASEPLTISDNRVILFSWAPGWFAKKKPTFMAWNGCFCLPREISLSANGALRQVPVNIGTRRTDCLVPHIKENNSDIYQTGSSCMIRYVQHQPPVQPVKIFYYGTNDMLLSMTEIDEEKVLFDRFEIPCNTKDVLIEIYCDGFLLEIFCGGAATSVCVLSQPVEYLKVEGMPPDEHCDIYRITGESISTVVQSGNQICINIKERGINGKD